MEKNRLSIIEKFENQFDILSKFPFLSLLIIGIGAIIIRLIFFQNELIFNSDNLSYFKYAIDISLTGESPAAIYTPNNGWPLFISIFFHFFESKNFLDYMNLQSYISMILSTVTIVPLYFLAKKFTNSSFAIISTIFFVFEPRIIQNSLTGVTDPFFILLIVTSLALIVQKNKYIIYGACITIGLASIVRAEGLFLIPTLCVMFLIKNKITKKNIIQCIIFIIIIYLILLPFSMQRIESTGTDSLTGRIMVETQTLTKNNPNGLELKIINSFYLFIQFLGKLMIPYLIIFVPLGIILFLKEKNIQKSLLIIPVFFMILPSLYAYTVPALDSRYLFPILPILCIFGTFSCMKYFEKIKYKKIGIGLVIIIVIVLSISFLDFKSTDMEKEQDFLKLGMEINKKTDIIFFENSPITLYVELSQLSELKEFPIMSSKWFNENKIKDIDYNDIEDFFSKIKKNGITHLVIDEEVDNSIILNKIFSNYDKYKNLKKIFDSEESGFKYKIKIFEIKNG